jgi:protein-S-isoprenylcysteine O-methyltransferase Ste14
VTRSRVERALDGCFALTVYGWAIASVVHEPDRPLAVGIALAAVNAVVGTLFLVRGAPIDPGGVAELARALPSIVASGLAYRVATREWPTALVIAHAGFAALAIVSLLALGQSFAVLPSRRALVTRGPFAIVRNPIYLGELGMIGSACATRGVLVGFVGLAVTTALLAPRILAEERLLGADEAFASYRARVRHRLLPGIW